MGCCRPELRQLRGLAVAIGFDPEKFGDDHYRKGCGEVFDNIKRFARAEIAQSLFRHLADPRLEQRNATRRETAVYNLTGFSVLLTILCDETAR